MQRLLFASFVFFAVKFCCLVSIADRIVRGD
jgi:hypothetical protein